MIARESESRPAVDLARRPNSLLRRLRWVHVLPLVVVAIIGVFLGLGLGRDPGRIPSALIGKSVPKFELPPVAGRTLGLSDRHLVGEVSLVNVFASWCTACRDEHPLLMKIKTKNVVAVHGLNYKDRPQDARKWLDELGDPYTRTGADLDGRVGIDWGVYGVPETFVIDRKGRIAFKQVGPVNPDVLEKTILPLVRRLRDE